MEEVKQTREARRKGREHDQITAASTVRGLSVSHWKVHANAKSAWAGADSGQGECDSSLCWLTTIPWGWGQDPVRSMCLLRSHITSGEQVVLKLLLRWGQLAFKDIGMRIILSSILLHPYYILASILLLICALLSTETSVWESVSMKTKIQTLEWWERVVWMMGWQSHLDDYFNTAGALLNYWFCTNVHRDFYNSLTVVTLMKYNKQAQFQFPFYITLIWFCITSQSSFVGKFHQQIINLYCMWWYQK